MRDSMDHAVVDAFAETLGNESSRELLATRMFIKSHFSQHLKLIQSVGNCGKMSAQIDSLFSHVETALLRHPVSLLFICKNAQIAIASNVYTPPIRVGTERTIHHEFREQCCIFMRVINLWQVHGLEVNINPSDYRDAIKHVKPKVLDGQILPLRLCR